jgi:hypothetical protein
VIDNCMKIDRRETPLRLLSDIEQNIAEAGNIVA